MDNTSTATIEIPPLNDELQRYLGPSNRTARIQDGALKLTAVRDPASGGVVSARLSTFGKYSFAYGVVETRLKVPYRQGLWPAFWMLGSDIREVGWPACGELDIMEVFGTRRGPHACSTVHNPRHSWGTRDPLDGDCAAIETPTPGWHVWSMEWHPERIVFYVDDHEIFRYARDLGGDGEAYAAAEEQYPYTRPSYFVANVAVGGNGPSQPVEWAALEGEGTSLLVDYVRVYALDDDADVQGHASLQGPPLLNWLRISEEEHTKQLQGASGKVSAPEIVQMGYDPLHAFLQGGSAPILFLGLLAVGLLASVAALWVGHGRRHLRHRRALGERLLEMPTAV